MYLEISPRRSGKTTRLIDFIIKESEKGRLDRLRLVSSSMEMSKNTNDILRRNGHPGVMSYPADTIASTNCGDVVSRRGLEEIDLILDEFEFMPPVSLGVMSRVKYAATTPARKRTLRHLDNIKEHLGKDNLLTLLWKNEFKYVCELGSLVESRHKLCHLMSEEEVSLFLFGQFLKVDDGDLHNTTNNS